MADFDSGAIFSMVWLPSVKTGITGFKKEGLPEMPSDALNLATASGLS